MSRAEWLGVLLGGIVPAVLFAAMALFTKLSSRYDTGVGYFMLAVAAAVFLVGLLALQLFPLRSLTLVGGGAAFLGGLSWALAAALMAFAMLHYNAPVSKLGALNNTSALLVAIAGLLFFREGEQINVAQLLIGALLIVIGGVLVVRA